MNDSAAAVPKVSVIIPLYNKAPYIKRALDSVLAQTVQDFEVVVVGGNSSDGGEDIVKGYTDSRIRFIQETGKGVSAARNQAVDAAKAELVAFLDADDEWLPEFLETILRLKERYPEAGLYGTGSIFDNGDSSSTYSCVFNADLGEQEITNYFRAKNITGSFLIITSGMAIPKSKFIEVGGFPIGFSQNEDRCLRGKLMLSYPAAYSPKKCVLYHVCWDTYLSRGKNYLEDPFALWIKEHDNILQNTSNKTDIIEFAERGMLGVSSWNIKNHNDPKRIRSDLKTITSPILKKSVRKKMFQSHMPAIYFRIKERILKQLAKIYHRIIK